MPNDDLKKQWSDPNAFAEIARRIGQGDPQAWRWKPPANENAPPIGVWQKLLAAFRRRDSAGG